MNKRESKRLTEDEIYFIQWGLDEIWGDFYDELEKLTKSLDGSCMIITGEDIESIESIQNTLKTIERAKRKIAKYIPQEE